MAKPLVVDEIWKDRILEQVAGLQYGQVIITVHDGRIVQIDRTERTRYDNIPQKQTAAEPVKQEKTRAKSKPADPEKEEKALRAVQ